MPADRASAIRAPASAWREFVRSSGIAGFFVWWAGELAPLVPRATRAAVKRRRLRPVLAFDQEQVTLWQPVAQDGGIGMRSVGAVALAGDAADVEAAGRALVDRLPRMVYGGAVAAPRVTLALAPRQVLRRALTLPAAIEENLRQALAYDLDRHTPFRAEDLYFDAAVVARDPASGTIRVDLAAARRSVVDPAIQRAESFGATVAAVSPDDPTRPGESRLSLVPEERRVAPGMRHSWQFWVPFTMLVMAALAAAAIPILQKRQYAIALHQQVDEARVRASVSEGLRAELDRLSADYNFALERKFAYPASVAVLEEITKLLPDDTWLTQMELKSTSRGKESQRELLLRGESANAGRLITLFEESKVFAQAAPRSPTTKIQPGPGEIFDLAAQLRTLPMPAPVALAANEAPRPATAPASRPPPAAPLPPAGQATPDVAAPPSASPGSAADAPNTQANAAPTSGPLLVLPPGVTPAPAAAGAGLAGGSAPAPVGVPPAPAATGSASPGPAPAPAPPAAGTPAAGSAARDGAMQPGPTLESAPRPAQQRRPNRET